jgi:hypothetical protein
MHMRISLSLIFGICLAALSACNKHSGSEVYAAYANEHRSGESHAPKATTSEDHSKAEHAATPAPSASRTSPAQFFPK